MLATDLADYLVRKEVPFREAHHAVGAVVAYAEKNQKALNQLSVKELRAIDKRFTNDALDIFNLSSAMRRRKLTGAPGTSEVRTQLARWKKALQ